jgi:glycosyltransferase involved in cell wall biosynthesis
MTRAERDVIPVLELVVSTQPGGGPEHVRALARRLPARGFAPIVGGPHDGALFDQLRDEGVDVVEVPTDRIGPSALRRVIRVARERGARVIHSHGKGAGLYGRLAARALGVPAVHTFHGIHYERYGVLGRAVYLALERALARATALTINVSRAQEAEALSLGLCDRTRTCVIPNGVDVDRLAREALTRDEARRRVGAPASARVVGAVARFDPVKGLDVLIDAIARVPDAVLVVVGDGAARARIHQRASAAGIMPRARFVGEVPEAWRLYRAFDVLASASSKEGMPLAMLEAMALGLAVVASDIPAHREVLGGTATLAPREAAPFAAALTRMLDDAALRAAAGEANRARARACYDVERMVDAVADAYRIACGL